MTTPLEENAESDSYSLSNSHSIAYVGHEDIEVSAIALYEFVATSLTDRRKLPQGNMISINQRRGRLWLNDGSCVCLRSEYRNHVRSYNFVHHRTDDDRAFSTSNILGKHNREYLANRVKRKLNSIEVIDALTDLFILRAGPASISSDNGPQFIAEAARGWIKTVGAKPTRITLENG